MEPMGKAAARKFLIPHRENTKIYNGRLYNKLNLYNYGKGDYISSTILKYKLWEPPITKVIEFLLGEGKDKYFVDVGCNIGYYSIIAAPLSKKVISIDAHLPHLTLLQASKIYNKLSNINIIHKGISDKEEILYLQNESVAHKYNNLGLLYYSSQTDLLGLGRMPLEVDGLEGDTLDNIMDVSGAEVIDLLKIDIESGELKALKGAFEWISRGKVKNIIVEISPALTDLYHKDKDESEEILKYLQHNNYVLYEIPYLEVGPYIETSRYVEREVLEQGRIDNIPHFLASMGPQTNILARLQ